jgi:hypothetical protein
VADVQVSGIWDNGDLGFCVTDSEGWCEVKLTKIPLEKDVTFTIFDLIADGYLYDGDEVPVGPLSP